MDVRINVKKNHELQLFPLVLWFKDADAAGKQQPSKLLAYPAALKTLIGDGKAESSLPCVYK